MAATRAFVTLRPQVSLASHIWRASQIWLLVAAAGCGSGNGENSNPGSAGRGGGGAGTGGSAVAGTGGGAAGTGGVAGTGGGPAGGTTGGAVAGTGGGIAGTGGGIAGTGGGIAGTGGAGMAGTGSGGVAGTGGGGNAGTGGIAGSGGSSTAGTGGTSSVSCGGASMGGAAGTSATPAICSFQIDATLSPAISTVGIVNWSTDLAGLSEARIEFTLNDAAPSVLNRGGGGKIDISGTTHRALMLGLKAGRTYTYRIVATGAGGKVCTSPDRTLATCTAANIPTVTRTVASGAAPARGFIVVTNGVQDFGMTRPRAPQLSYIIDADGDVVWWTDTAFQTSRAIMDSDGAYMWMVTPGGGNCRRVGMDGMGAENVAGLTNCHHDIAVLSDGTMALLVNTTEMTRSSDLIERAADGTLKTVVRLDSKIYKPTGSFHANSIRYHAADDSYTVGDRDARLIVKLTRQGKLLWQLGGDCTGAPAPKCASNVPGGATHGQQQVGSGNLLVFKNGTPAQIAEYALTETATSLTATTAWSYQATGADSELLGDVQRLPNGNTLITFSTDGEIREVTPAGAVVQTINANYFGYSNFRESLYGPPLPY